MKNPSRYLTGLLVILLLTVSCTNETSSKGSLTIKPTVQYFPGSNAGAVIHEDSLVFRAKTQNIGACRKDTTLSFAYTLFNRSKSNVLISGVRGSCGCLSFDYKRNEIRPNEETKINVTFRSGSTEGFFKKEVYIKLKSGRTITLSFYGSVV